MNRKIAYIWIILILLGFISTDFIDNIFILACMWSGILILGSTAIVKYGWSQNKFLCVYWIITLTLSTILSGFQLSSIYEGNKLIPFQHISTIWMLTLGVNFIVTTVFSKILFFAPLGGLMIATALPLDMVKMSFPASTYGILLSIVMIGYTFLTFLTPNDKFNLGNEFNEVNGMDEEILTQMHKFKCTNCGYIYEGHQKVNYCPRCMAGADLLVDVD